MKTISGQRSAVSHKRRKGKKRSFITTTYRMPRWRRDLRATAKSFKRQARTMLAAAGFIWLVYMLARVLGGG